MYENSKDTKSCWHNHYFITGGFNCAAGNIRNKKNYWKEVGQLWHILT